MSFTEIHWACQEIRSALQHGHRDLALRYLSKIEDQIRCVYCHGLLDRHGPYHQHYKGFVHDECSEQYSGRTHYLLQHPEEE